MLSRHSHPRHQSDIRSSRHRHGFVQGLPFSILILLLLPLLHWPGAAAAAGPPDRASTVRAVDAYLQRQVKDQGLPGLAVGLVHGQRIVHFRGLGRADDSGRPVTAQTPFVLASVSKPLTAFAVMQMVDAGKVELDAPVRHYLPWFRVADPGASARITVRNLLNHTSGIPNTACETDATTMDGFGRWLRTVHLDRPVGTRYVYCSGNYTLLGLIVQAVSHEPFSTYIQRHVFAPLQMHHSYATEEPAKRDGLAQGYAWLFGAKAPLSYYNPSDLPAGYLISSAEDMTHWLRAEMNGGRYGSRRLISPASLAAMREDSVPADSDGRYGLGWLIGSLGGVPAVYHYGDNYSLQSVAFIEPRTHWGAVILVNTNGILANDALRSMDAGVARILAGRAPGSTSIRLPTLYLIVDAILAVFTALVLLSIVRLRRWSRAVERRRRETRLWALRAGLRVAVEIVLPVLLVGGVYLFFNGLGANSWTQILLAVPDLVSWVLVISALMLLTATARGGMILWMMRSSRHVSESNEPRVVGSSAVSRRAG